ncbi:MAG: cupin [Gluconacetobacter diazotrophicus]|nr:cupin [Gluconacetobacter diazotrophicus]
MVKTTDFSRPMPPRALDRPVVTDGLVNCSAARLYSLGRNNWVPNNPTLPIVLYEDVTGALGTPEEYEDFVEANGWIPQWRDLGIFTYHHYHTVHEVLGVLRGYAVFVLGGDGGPQIHLRKGNVLALPAGTAHLQQFASEDFLLIGAYTPDHPDWDDVVASPSLRQRDRLARLNAPATDPTSGRGGFLSRLWAD